MSLATESEGVATRPLADRAATITPGTSHKCRVYRTTIIVTAVMLLALAAPALCGLIYTADDLGAFHLPLRAFYARALAAGDAFDWCSDLYGGFYLTGEGQVGAYHPLHWLLYSCLPLPWAWNLECLVAYPFLLAGVHALLRRHGLSSAVSLFGAIICTFSGFNLLHFVHVNAIAVIAHVPWLLYATDWLKRSRTDCQSVVQRKQVIPPSLLVAALTGSQLLLGYPQYVLYSLIAEFSYLVCILYGASAGLDSMRGFKLASIWSAAKLLGLCLAAVQVLPTFDALGDSVRQTADQTFSGSGSLHPLNAVQLVAPYLFTTRVVGQNTHELTFYVGMAPLLLAMVAIANRRQIATHAALRTLGRFAVVLVAVGAVIAIGKYGPMHRLINAVPLLSYFRFPCRATVLVQLGLGLMAAIGFALVLRTSATSKANAGGNQAAPIPGKTFVFLMLASMALAAAAPMLWREHTAAMWLVCIGPLLMVAATMLVVRAVSGGRLAMHGLVLFTAIDLAAYGLSCGAYREIMQLDDFVAQTRAPSNMAAGRVALDLALPTSEGMRAGNEILLRGFSRIDGYAGLEPAKSLDYRQPSALQVAGVSAIAPDAPVERRSELRSDANGWRLVPNPSPRARFVDKFKPTNDPAADIVHIDVQDTVLIQDKDRPVVESHLRSAAASAGGIAWARTVTDRPGHLVVETDCPRPAVLVLTENYHSGWTAATDGVPRQPLRLNSDFLGCLVEPGRSTIEFCFAPVSLGHGRLLSVCGLGLFGILLAASRLPRFRRP